MRAQVERLVSGTWAENCYIVAGADRRALIIDPGGGAEELLARIAARHLEVVAVMCTHGHHDHVGAVKALQDRLGVPFLIHSADERVLRLASLFAKLYDEGPPIPLPRVDAHLDEVKELPRLEDQATAVIPTPGHTVGSVCLGLAGALFVGDTLLKGCLARMDPKFGNAGQLRESLRRLSVLDPATVLFPGHGEPTTLAEELRSNCAFKEAIG